ncbi:MAG: penicillin acylase family protein [Vicinamibacterales bacterium]
MGSSGDVDIVRDADAIPHIFATTKRDGLFGLGYAHAQDRLWQMEFQRRIGHGRLSEIFGSATIAQDRFLRTVGFGRAARKAWDRLPPETRGDVDAYVDGINAFISTHRGRKLPPEFTLLRFEPEPFTGVDVLVWVEDDGLGPERQLLVRAAAPRSPCEARTRSGQPAPAAIPGRRPEHPRRSR